MRIGFIGLGNMGGPMVRNLAEAGHEVVAFDISAERLAALGGIDNVQAASAINQTTAGAAIVVTMLPASVHVESVYLDNDLLGAIDTSTLAIDCSTIAPATSRRVAAAARERGIDMLDAPVSGGTGGAEAGTLTFMVGGSDASLARARPVLEVMGSNIFHAGDAGAGQTAKICNNMLLAAQMTATAEALALGVAQGLDPAVLSSIMQASSGGNWPLNVYNPWPGVMEGVPASRGYEGGFFVDLMIKDLELALAAANEAGTPTAMGSLARNLYRTHQATNNAGALDFSSIQRLIAPDAGE